MADSPRLELTLRNRSEEISRVHDALDKIATQQGLSSSAKIARLHLALEELLANIISHGYPPGQTGSIVVRFAWVPTELRVEVEDDGQPFNINDAPPVDTSVPMDLRPIGGLGVLLIRNSVDHLEYRFENNRNWLGLIVRIQ